MRCHNVNWINISTFYMQYNKEIKNVEYNTTTKYNNIVNIQYINME